MSEKKPEEHKKARDDLTNAINTNNKSNAEVNRLHDSVNKNLITQLKKCESKLKKELEKNKVNNTIQNQVNSLNIQLNEITKQLSEQTTKNANLEAEGLKLKEQITKLTKELEECNIVKGKVEQQLNALKEGVKQLSNFDNERINEINDLYEQTSEKHGDTHQSLMHVKNLYKNMLTELNNFRENNDHLTTENQRLKEKNTVLLAENIKLNDDVINRIKNLKEQYNFNGIKNNVRYNKVKNQLDTYEKKIKEIQTIENDNKLKNDELKKLKEQIDELTTENQKLKEQLEKLDTDFKNMNDLFKTNSIKLISYSNKITLLQTQLVNYNKIINIFNSNPNDNGVLPITQRIQSFQRYINNFNDQLRNCNDKIKDEQKKQQHLSILLNKLRDLIPNENDDDDDDDDYDYEKIYNDIRKGIILLRNENNDIDIEFDDDINDLKNTNAFLNDELKQLKNKNNNQQSNELIKQINMLNDEIDKHKKENNIEKIQNEMEKNVLKEEITSLKTLNEENRILTEKINKQIKNDNLKQKQFNIFNEKYVELTKQYSIISDKLKKKRDKYIKLKQDIEKKNKPTQIQHTELLKSKLVAQKSIYDNEIKKYDIRINKLIDEIRNLNDDNQQLVNDNTKYLKHINQLTDPNNQSNQSNHELFQKTNVEAMQTLNSLEEKDEHRRIKIFIDSIDVLDYKNDDIEWNDVDEINNVTYSNDIITLTVTNKKKGIVHHTLEKQQILAFIKANDDIKKEIYDNSNNNFENFIDNIKKKFNETGAMKTGGEIMPNYESSLIDYGDNTHIEKIMAGGAIFSQNIKCVLLVVCVLLLLYLLYLIFNDKKSKQSEYNKIVNLTRTHNNSNYF